MCFTDKQLDHFREAAKMVGRRSVQRGDKLA
mgnify:CR=1 FL=1